MRKHRALLFSCLEYLAFYLCRYNLPPILPFLIVHFGVTHGEIGALASASFASYAIVLLPAGFLVPPNVGPLLAYVASTYLASYYDWRAAFLYPSFALLTLTVLFWLLIRDQPPQLSGAENRHVSIRERLGLVLSSRDVWFIALAYACYMCIYRSLLVWLPTYLTEETHLPQFSASVLGGLATLSGIGSMFLGAFLAGVKSRGRSRLIIALSFGLTLAVVWMLPWVEDATRVLILFSLVFAFLNLGGSLYFAYSPVFLSKKVVGTASGFIDSIAYVGSFLGVLLTGLIFDAYLSYDPVFTILAIIAAAGAVFALLVGKWILHFECAL